MTKVVVPLCLGIFFGRMMAEQGTGHVSVSGLTEGVACAAGLCFLLCIALYARRAGRLSVRTNTLFGLSVVVFFFLFGAWRSAFVWREVKVTPWDGERTFYVVLTDVPRPGERAVVAEGLAAPCTRADGWHKVSVAFSRDAQAERLAVGSRVECRTVFHSPTNRGNPDEFDYADYLAVKGIVAQSFLPSGRWSFVPDGVADGRKLPWTTALRIKALVWRDRLLAFYRRVGLQGEEYALLSALTLGEKSALSRELRDLYAATGVSHILALSGMHLGFLMMFFHWLFVRCGRRRARQAVVGTSALGLMWIYVLVAGLPVSLIRAAAMYTLMWTAVMFGRKGISFHTLTVSAFLMLCLHPAFLFDTGFRLSFLAMAGILTVYPLGKDLAPMRGRAGWFFRSLWLSFSAQLFTLPLSLHCFGVFSPYSVWATLLVTPLTALLLFSMPLLLVAGAMGGGVLSGFLVYATEGLIRVQHFFLQTVASLPASSVSVDMPVLTLCVTYVLLATLVLFRNCSSTVRLKALCALLSLLVAVRLFESRRRVLAPSVVFYNVPSCPVVHVIPSPEHSYLFVSDADEATKRMASIRRTFWRKRLKATPVTVTGDCRNGDVAARSGWVRTKEGLSFLMLYDGRWNNVASSGRISVDYVLLCHGYKGRLNAIAPLFAPGCVVLDVSLRSGERRRYVQECKKLGWRYYDMDSRGALSVPLR